MLCVTTITILSRLNDNGCSRQQLNNAFKNMSIQCTDCHVLLGSTLRWPCMT